jgi:hypothetical protein
LTGLMNHMHQQPAASLSMQNRSLKCSGEAELTGLIWTDIAGI